MIKITWIVFGIVLTLALTTCSNKSTSITGEYSGYWLESKFTYKFNEDYKFSFLTEGHIGSTETEGKYKIIDSIIFIDHPLADRNEVLQDQLVIKGNKCLRDYRTNYYCENVDLLELVNQERFQVVDSIKKQLRNLPKVKQITKRFTDYKNYHLFPRFEHDEIKLIELYQKKYGFNQYGRYLGIEGEESWSLIRKYIEND